MTDDQTQQPKNGAPQPTPGPTAAPTPESASASASEAVPERELASTPAHEPVPAPELASASEAASVPASASVPAPEPGADPAFAAGATPGPESESASASRAEPTPASATDPATEATSGRTPGAGSASVPEPTSGSAPEPAAAAGPAPGLTPEPGAEPTPEPLPESASVAESASAVEVTPGSEVTPEPLPEADHTPSEPVVLSPPVATKRRKRRGRIAAVAVSVLLAGAVVGGVGYTVVTVNGADRDAGAAVWKYPETKSADAKKASAKGLPGMLVAYGNGWRRGPDFGQFAADTELSGAQATALRKESLRGLPRSERRQLEKLIDRQHIKGMAMRSYAKEAGGSFFTDSAVAVNIVLSQMENSSDVRRISTSQNAFLAGLDIFRKGPKIKGHEEAGCYLPPKGTDKDLDSMYCSAYRGDILITVSADGVKPFDSKGVAELLKDQLDRVAEPGEAV